VTVSDSGETDGVVIDVGNEALEVLDHPYSTSIDGRGTAVIRWFGGLVGLGGRKATFRQATLEGGRTWAQPGHRVSGLACVDVFAGSACGTANGLGAALNVHRVFGTEPGSGCAAARAAGCSGDADAGGSARDGAWTVKRSVYCCRLEENETGDGEIRWDEEHVVLWCE
jgi:hypothetical protein